MEKAREPVNFCRFRLGMSYQGRAIYVPEEYTEEAKKRIGEWEKKGEFPEALRTQSHSLKSQNYRNSMGGDSGCGDLCSPHCGICFNEQKGGFTSWKVFR